MNQKKIKSPNNRNQQKILTDHKRVGKHFIPPMVEYGNFEEIKWVDSKLPELLWLGLLNHLHGPAKGLNLGLSLALAAAKAYANQEKPWFGSTSAYSLLNDKQQEEILTILRPNNLQPLKEALLIFPVFYPECPLNFLFEGAPSILINVEPLLDDFKHLLSALTERISLPLLCRLTPCVLQRQPASLIFHLTVHWPIFKR